jgi:hypothetical protein
MEYLEENGGESSPVAHLVAEKGRKATANTHGFGSGYRLTATPDNYEV